MRPTGMPPTTTVRSTSPSANPVLDLHVAILVGPPGAGKSTFVEDLERSEKEKAYSERRTIWVVSADSFFMKNGEYLFDPTKIAQAHEECLLRYSIYLREISKDMMVMRSRYRATVVVDNTNSTVLEIAPYYALARAYSASVELVHFDAHPRACFERQRHGVPAERVEAMWRSARSVEPPPYWQYSERVITDSVSYARYAHVALPEE